MGKKKNKNQIEKNPNHDSREDYVENRRQERMKKQHFRKQSERFKYGDDNWKSDFRRFSDQLAIYNLFIKDVAGDGNCLFRAISDQIEGNPENHNHYRQLSVDFMEQQRMDFEPFVEDDVPFDRYAANMRKNATWGGNMEIQALSLALQVNIVIHQLDSPRWEVQNWGPGTRTIHLSYHSGDHYASVRPNGQFTGIPEPIDLTKTIIPAIKPNANTKSKELVSETEKIVMDSTGCDLVTVRQTLEDMQNDMDAAIEYLVSIRQTEMGIHPPADDNPPDNNSNNTIQPTTTTSTVPDTKEPEKPVNNTHVESFSFETSNYVDELKRQLEAMQSQEEILRTTLATTDDPEQREIFQTTLDILAVDRLTILDQIQQLQPVAMFEQDRLLAMSLSEQRSSGSSSSQPSSSSFSGSNNNTSKSSSVESWEKQKEKQKLVERANQVYQEKQNKGNENHKPNKEPKEKSKSEQYLERAAQRKSGVHPLSDQSNDNSDVVLKKHPNLKKQLTNRERKELARLEKQERKANKDRKKDTPQPEIDAELAARIAAMDLGGLQI